MQYRFEWDSKKANTNMKKHKVSFEDAATVFKDSNALTIYDGKHSSDQEDRFITLGLAFSGRLLIVVHTFYELNQNICIVSRKPIKEEKNQYIRG